MTKTTHPPQPTPPAALLPAILTELRRPDTDHPLFHGSYDWHSAVHGHWAGLWLAQSLGQSREADEIRNRITATKLTQELQYLKEYPKFEMPYGRAWLLRLAILLDDHPQAAPDVFLPVAQGLQHWLRNHCPPADTREYHNPCWVLLQLFAWARHTDNAALTQWCRDFAQAFSTQFVATLADDQDESAGFFSCWALQTRVLEQILGAESLHAWLQKTTPADGIHMVKHSHTTIHHLGIHASRAWGMASAAAATGAAHWKRAWEVHTLQSLALHPQWQHDHVAYAHWVPQFTVYALACGNKAGLSLNPTATHPMQ